MEIPEDMAYIKNASYLTQVENWPDQLLEQVGVKAFLVETPYHAQAVWVVIKLGDKVTYDKLCSDEEIVLSREEFDMFSEAAEKGLVSGEMIAGCLKSKRILGGFAISVGKEGGEQVESGAESAIERGESGKNQQEPGENSQQAGGAAGLF